MKSVRIILLMMVLAMALLACQADERSTAAPVERATQTESSESGPGSTTTQALSPTPGPEETNMIPVTPPNEAAQRMVNLVKQHLAQGLNITVDQIVLSDVKPVVWRDAGLGCPKPGVDYIQVETPGYNILLEADGNSYRYHTDETRRFVPCSR